MPWLDLEEGILDEFAERGSYGASDSAREMLIERSARTFKIKCASPSSNTCTVCDSPIPAGCWTKAGHDPTCSKRCRQILRRRTLLAQGTCPQCKGPMDRDGSICIQCCSDFANRWTASKKVLEMKRKAIPKSIDGFSVNDRVLVVGCSGQDTSDVYAVISQFIGKRGRVITIRDDAPEVVVMFRKGRHRFRSEELSKIS